MKTTEVEKEIDVKLVREIEKFMYHLELRANTPPIPDEYIDDTTIYKIAQHFFELGQKDAASKFDEIEYNRQRTEEKMSNKTLDEAAEEHVKNKYGLAKLLGAEFREAVNDFIAGAKWMAEQGVSWEDKMTYYDGILLYGKDERAFTMEGNFNEGDKVIVQIRKKED